MQLIYGTTNLAKLQHMREMTAALPLHIVGLEDIGASNLPDVEETGKQPVDNAKQKAIAYYKWLRQPVFSCDSGLFIDGLLDEQQPGTEIRRVGGQRLDDEQMIEYYQGIAAAHGGRVQAQYLNSICLVLDEERVHCHQGLDISTPPFWLIDRPHRQRLAGLPLDSISVTQDTDEYFVVLRHRDNANDWSMAEGFCSFFRRSLGTC